MEEEKNESKESTKKESKEESPHCDINEHLEKISENLENENIIEEEIKTLKLSNGVIYEGEVKNGKRQGRGKQKWKEGTIFEGEWKNDQATGKGI